jgi:hypothetical protein
MVLTMLLLPLMGCNWLFFLVMLLVIQIIVRFVVETLASESDFNGLVVSMLASGTQVRGFKPV